MGRGRHTRGVERLDVLGVLEHGRQLPGEQLDLFVGHVEAGQCGHMTHVGTGDLLGCHGAETTSPLTNIEQRCLLLRVLENPIRDRRAERREATRAEIVEAAWALVRVDGLAALSLRDLAGRVGMQAPSLYSYFASKNDIFDAMYAEGAHAFVRGEGALVWTGDPLSDLKTIGRFFVEFSTDDPVRYQLLFQRTIPGFEPSAESFAISVASLTAMQERFASIGLTDDRSVDLFTALGTGLTDQQISNDPGGDRWTRLIDEATEMFFNHLMSQKPRTSKGGSTK